MSQKKKHGILFTSRRTYYERNLSFADDFLIEYFINKNIF